jgi:hypothetical protein
MNFIHVRGMGARAVSEKYSILDPRSSVSVSVDGDDDVDDGGTNARVVCIHDDERDDDDEHDDEHDDAVGSVRDARFSRESVEKSR